MNAVSSLDRDLAFQAVEQPTIPECWRIVCSKMNDRGWSRRRMRHPASEKLAIIEIVERSHLPAKRTLVQLGIARWTFYRTTAASRAARRRWGGPAIGTKRVWDRIPTDVHDQIIELALDQSELFPRTSGALHQRKSTTPCRKPRLPPVEGERPNRQPGLGRDQVSGRVPPQDPAPERDMAGRLYLLIDRRPGFDRIQHIRSIVRSCSLQTAFNRLPA